MFRPQDIPRLMFGEYFPQNCGSSRLTWNSAEVLFYHPFEELINTFLGRKRWFMTSCFILKLRNIPKFRSYSLLVGWYASKCHLLFIWYFFLTFVISNFQILKNFAFLSFFSCQMWSRNWLKMLFRSDFDQISTFFLGRLVPNFNRSPISIQD